MYSRLLTICLMTMLIANCGNHGSVPVVVDTACDWVKPIYLTNYDIDVMNKLTKRDVLVHNKLWGKNCSNYYFKSNFIDSSS